MSVEITTISERECMESEGGSFETPVAKSMEAPAKEIRHENENKTVSSTHESGQLSGEVKEYVCQGSSSPSQTESCKSDLRYNKNQWSPSNPEGKKAYDREFLLQLQTEPLSLRKPSNLPDLKIIKNEPYDAVSRCSLLRKNSLTVEVEKKSKTPPLSDDEDFEIQKLYKNVWSILHNLTRQNLNKSVRQIKDMHVDTEEKLQAVVDLLYERAIDDICSSSLYVLMCKQLEMMRVELSSGIGTVNFRTLFTNKCREKFEESGSDSLKRSGKPHDAVSRCSLLGNTSLMVEEEKKSETPSLSDDEDFKTQEEEENLLQRENELWVKREFTFRNIRLIGELFRQNMVTEPAVHECIEKLLEEGEDEDGSSLICLCHLLVTTGLLEQRNRAFKKHSSKEDPISDYIARMKKIVVLGQTSTSVRSIVEGFLTFQKLSASLWTQRTDYAGWHEAIALGGEDLSKERVAKKVRPLMDEFLHNNDYKLQWIIRRDENNPKTIDQIHKEAEKEDREKQQMLQNMQFLKQMLGDRRKTSGSSSFTGRFFNHDSGWITNKPCKTNLGVDTTKLQLTKHTEADNIQLGPASGRIFNWGRGKSCGKNAATNTDENKALALRGEDLSKEEIEKKVRPLMDEFLHNNDYEEATRCITELASPNTMHMVITEAVNQVLERSSQARCMFGQLLRDLSKSKIVTMEQYNKGLKSVLELVDEYALDIPKIWEYLGEIMEPMIESSTCNLSFLKETLQPCIPSLAAGKLVSAILHCASNKRGTIKIGKMWQESGLSWTDFLPSDISISDFISSQKLEFTVSSVKLEPPSDMSVVEMKKQIGFLLNANASNEDIYDYVESHVGDECMAKPDFVRALVTCVFENVIGGSGEDCSVDPDKAKQRFPVISRYVNGKDDLKLQTLYAAQAVANRLNQPKGLLKQIFDLLCDIITEESYKRWEKSTDPAEQEGKAVA